MTNLPLASDQVIDVYELNYMFAVQKIDPRLGRITAAQVDYAAAGIKHKTEIPMVDCRELIMSSDHQDDYIHNRVFNPYMAEFRFPTEYLCPNVTSLLVQGHFNSKYFKYAEIKLRGCD